MHCPKCGQHQVSDDVRFCSRCGFSLSLVSEALKDQRNPGSSLSPRELKKSALIGFGLVTLSAVFLLVTLIIGTPEPNFVVQLNLLVAILVYLFALVYVFFKFRGPPRADFAVEAEARMIERAATTRELLNEPDLTDFVPANATYPKSGSEAAPVSVTEDTTVLLKDDR